MVQTKVFIAKFILSSCACDGRIIQSEYTINILILLQIYYAFNNSINNATIIAFDIFIAFTAHQVFWGKRGDGWQWRAISLVWNLSS